MKTIYYLLLALSIVLPPNLYAASNTFLDYQNYNHGYCPDCNCAPCNCEGECPLEEAPCEDSPCDPPCDPPCPSCPTPNPCSPPMTTTCTECGINVCYLGLGLAVLIGTAVIIVSNGNGYSH